MRITPLKILWESQGTETVNKILITLFARLSVKPRQKLSELLSLQLHISKLEYKGTIVMY